MSVINECIIVEGKNDKLRILQIYPDAIVMITDGSSVEEHLELFKKIALKRDLILFLDPDYPGEKIRKTIANVIPNVKHAFIKKENAKSKNHKKIGVEHAKREDIINSLSNLISYSNNEVEKKEITKMDLYELGLSGKDNSFILRKKVSDYYNIGIPNSKCILERINLLGISLDEIRKIIEEN